MAAQLGLVEQLRKEKDALRESLAREQSVNAELVRRFELEARSASEVHYKDKKCIEDLEREIKRCSQEIAFLQDQLCRSDAENHFLDEDMQENGKSYSEIKKLYEKVKLLEDELVQSDSMRIFFMNKAVQNDAELQQLLAQTEKLEASVISTQLESQCELESMRFDMMALEQRCFEVERSYEQVAKEKAQMDVMHKECSRQLNEAQQRVGSLEGKNRELHEKLASSENYVKVIFSKLDDHLDAWLKKYSTSTYQADRSNFLPPDLEDALALLARKGCSYVENLRPFLVKLILVTSSSENAKYEMQNLANQIRESERLINQLKEELRNEKCHSKEEAEDLTQAMAELRFQITGMLEEETKRRAMIEQASIQRIQELEAEVQKEKLKSFKATKNFDKACELVKSRDMEIQHLKLAVEGALETPTTNGSSYLDDSNFEDSYDADVQAAFTQACIEWYTNDTKEQH